jgi:IS6 family transposase
MSNGSWRVDETYVRVKGRWTYLYRGVDSRGQTIDFLLAARRDAAAKRFFRKALGQLHTANPRTITVDRNPAHPRATAEMKADGALWRFSRLRQVKFLNNIVEQDHRRMPRLMRPGLGFGSLWTAQRTLAGYEVMAMIRKGHVQTIGGRDMRARAAFVAELFEAAASSVARLSHSQSTAIFATEPDQLMSRLPPKQCKPALVADSTGVGRPVLNSMREAGLRPIGVTISGGLSEVEAAWDDWRVPKKVSASLLHVLLDGHQLKFAAGMPELDTLTREPASFRVKMTASRNESFEAWREREHDDLVLACALAVWGAEKKMPEPARFVHVPFMSRR